MLSLEIQCVLQHTVTWSNHISDARLRVWPVVLDSRALSFPRPSQESQTGCQKRTENSAVFKPGRVNLAKAFQLCAQLLSGPLQACDLVLCLLVQSHGVQPEEHFPLPVTSRGLPVLTAAPE